MMMPEDMIGAIKIIDGLFIGDQFAAQVIFYDKAGSRVRSGQQGDTRDQCRSQADTKPLGEYKGALPLFSMDGRRGLGKLL